MDKQKIIGLSNNDDLMWYRLAPTINTLIQLDSIFDICDYFAENNKVSSFEYEIEFGPGHFIKENQDFTAYFILTNKAVHVILRKRLKWKKYNDLINENFEFNTY